ncbi:unnamed protein product [Pylaiella littoralis]
MHSLSPPAGRIRRRCILLLAAALLLTTTTPSKCVAATAAAAAAAVAATPAATQADDEAKQQAINDPDAALVYGNRVLSSTPTIADFSTDPAFPTAETLFLLGRAHDEGREDVGIKRDEDVARELYEKAAGLGHPGAQHALSIILASSGDAEVEAILYDFFASLGGDPLAHAALGYRYLFGINTPEDCRMSLVHYHMAARDVIDDLYSGGRGGLARMVDRTRLSNVFGAGRRPTADADREMVNFWEAAAEVGDIAAIRAMGLLYQHGIRGVEQNFEKAFEMFQKGADLRDLHSTAYAANLLMRGAGTPPDHEAARQMFQISQASHVSLNGLGFLYFHGLGVERDIGEAYFYFEKAINGDKDGQNADAHFNMGLLFMSHALTTPLKVTSVDKSTGLPKSVTLLRDPQKALVCFNVAANMGHVEAAFQAALLYSKQEEMHAIDCQSAVGLMRNVVERGPWMESMRKALRLATAGDYGGALVLYSRLAESGVELAQSNAAWLLEAGYGRGCVSVNGTTVDCEKRALRLYEHAARQGRPSAQMKIGDFHYHGKAGLPVDYEKAAERYLKASDARYAEALFGMGYMYQMGKGVPQDLFLAKRYFDDAADVSADAVPVARLSLFLLRLQSAWIGLRDWWRGLQPERDREEGADVWRDGEGGGEGDGDGGGEGRREGAFSVSETVALAGLVMLLLMVMGERERRQRSRRLQENGGGGGGDGGGGGGGGGRGEERAAA